MAKRPLKAVGFCATELCHQDSFPSSENPCSITVVDDSDCTTGLCHQRKKIVEKTFSDDSLQPLIQARRKPLNGDGKPATKTVGLTVRGKSFYVKWKVPKRLQHIVGKSHFVKSLRTTNANDARRLIKAAGWEFEQVLRQAEGKAFEAVPEALQKHFRRTALMIIAIEHDCVMRTERREGHLVSSSRSVRILAASSYSRSP